MGSVASKSSSRRKHKGGPLPPPLPPKPLDPRIKLDPKEKFYLQKSWKTVARNEDVAAMTMFISLFRSSPEIKEKWPQLRKLSEDEMRGSPYLQKLSVRILGAMDHVIGKGYVKVVVRWVHKTGPFLGQSLTVSTLK
ncbi:CYGB [Branchiostoma lanceolatum]|uniref:CYGB protein n=1 Tax=Branchiostoma lanceolatum TaxID=7740 RepID=A0A8K0EG40_BRALA|nr:CYGB [Branchiostoma lanceolatum]